MMHCISTPLSDQTSIDQDKARERGASILNALKKNGEMHVDRIACDIFPDAENGDLDRRNCACIGSSLRTLETMGVIERTGDRVRIKPKEEGRARFTAAAWKGKKQW